MFSPSRDLLSSGKGQTVTNYRRQYIRRKELMQKIKQGRQRRATILQRTGRSHWGEALRDILELVRERTMQTPGRRAPQGECKKPETGVCLAQ